MAGLRLRQEGWAFVAGLAINLTASLILWHHHRDVLLDQWWPSLLELNAVRIFAATAAKSTISAIAGNVERALGLLASSPDDRDVGMLVLDSDYQFHRDLVDFQGNSIISNHYRLNAARLRLFRINIGEPLQRLDVAAKEHLKILDACLSRNADLAAKRLAQHIEISREHTLGIRPMRKTAGRLPTDPRD